MIIVITSLRLSSIWKFFTLANHGRKVRLQLRREPACLMVRTRGFGKTHYTMTLWNDEAAMKRFHRTGAHLAAMKDSARIASRIRIFTVEGDALPDWKTAKELLRKGRVYNY